MIIIIIIAAVIVLGRYAIREGQKIERQKKFINDMNNYNNDRKEKEDEMGGI